MSTEIHTATRVEIVNGALADSQASLQASYIYIEDSKLSFHQSEKRKEKLLEQINISLTILELMKRGSK